MRRGALPQTPPNLEEDDPIQNLKGRVLQPIKERLYRPLNRLISRLGYFPCVALLLALMGAGAMLVKAWNNPKEAKDTLTVARFYLDARELVPPRDADVADPIRELTNQLKDASSPANRDLQNGSYGPWTEAQLVVSLQGNNTIDSADIERWFEGQSGKCSCWREYATAPENLGVTGWVLLAFARVGMRPQPEQIEFVLQNQHAAGWWSMFPASDEPKNASTYATAFATWALAELSRRNLVDEPQKRRVAEAIGKGRGWLQDNTIPGKRGRWKNYPNGEYGEESISVSGLALHALHRTPGPPPQANDAHWMAHLPAILPMPKEETSSAQTVLTRQYGPAADPTHHFKLPWVLIATVDAYSAGGIAQRARAAQLFHQISDRQDSIRSDLKELPWLEAETLIALRYVRGDDII
jgi:hypothetical protein